VRIINRLLCKLFGHVSGWKNRQQGILSDEIEIDSTICYGTSYEISLLH
jgi:hypothetical protein